MGVLDDWELEQRAFHAAAKGVETTATPEQMQELIRDLWRAFCERTDALDETDRHLTVLVEALSEIKATDDGHSTQPIRDIIKGCLSEISTLKKAMAERKTKRDAIDWDRDVELPYVGMRPAGR
jgi:hypothetical protein